MSTHNLCFEQKYENIRIFIWKLSVFGSEIFNIFEQACFRDVQQKSLFVLRFYGPVRTAHPIEPPRPASKKVMKKFWCTFKIHY